MDITHRSKPYFESNYDVNEDLNYELVETYWEGKKIGKFLDTDEDGFFEQVICYAGNGVVSHIWSDWNGDFSQEKAKIYVEIPNQKEMQEWSFVDNDGNGFFDEVKILDFVP